MSSCTYWGKSKRSLKQKDNLLLEILDRDNTDQCWEFVDLWGDTDVSWVKEVLRESNRSCRFLTFLLLLSKLGQEGKLSPLPPSDTVKQRNIWEWCVFFNQDVTPKLGSPLVRVKPVDTTKSKTERKNDVLLLIITSKESARIFPRAVSHWAAKLGEFYTKVHAYS